MKMDLETAKWLVDKAQNDISAFPVEFEECEQCGAAYLPFLKHDCDHVIDIPFHTVADNDKVEPIT